MATILLMRHGENEWVKKGRLAGWIPGVHLNSRGQDQAQQATDRLSHLPVKAIYSSPVTRCMETAQYVADAMQLPVQELPAVGEVRYGKWEGKKIKKLAKKKSWGLVQFFPSRFQFPQGESFSQVQKRAVDALEEISRKHEKEVILVCSHADVIKLMLAYYLGVHMDLFQRVAIDPASITAIHLPTTGYVRVLRVNDTGLFSLAPRSKSDEEE